ncbi:MAG: zinc ribbon domain-containing protein [Acidobacteria bacterium]|nr:zinc ribbon domain-containing protein [Acidobacteriota bacterium]
MPIFEYRCRVCGHHFEVLSLPSSASTPPACASCQSLDVEKLLSLFAVDSEGSRESARAAGTKLATATSRDKLHAQREYEEKHRH